jgi:hypothetical protein
MRHDPRVDASCPRCGAGAPAGAVRCRACGFRFLEEPARRGFPWGALLAVAAVAAVVALAAAVLTRDSPPGPVDSAGAAERLAEQLRGGGVADLEGVECGGAVRRGALTRCEASYRDGDTQLLLVTLTARDELDVQNPYPAQRRPGG